MDLHKTNFQPTYNEASLDHENPYKQDIIRQRRSQNPPSHHAPWRLSGGSPDEVGGQSLNPHIEGRDGATFCASILSAVPIG